jgi:hypothetical protein
MLSSAIWVSEVVLANRETRLDKLLLRLLKVSETKLKIVLYLQYP